MQYCSEVLWPQRLKWVVDGGSDKYWQNFADSANLGSKILPEFVRPSIYYWRRVPQSDVTQPIWTLAYPGNKMPLIINADRPTTAALLGLTQAPTVVLIDITEPLTNYLAGLAYPPQPPLIKVTDTLPHHPWYFGKPAGDKYITIDRVSLKKSPSMWLLWDYRCEACGKTFTQCHTMHEHRRYRCKNLATEKRPKVECPNCEKMLSKKGVYQHLRNGCSLLRPPPKDLKTLCPNCKMLSKAAVYKHCRNGCPPLQR